MDFIKISDFVFPTELAISYQEQETGLMHKEAPTPVMSFVYAEPRVNKFWMRNTKSPLDIVFCFNGKIMSICQGQPFSLYVIGDDRPSDLVVEFPADTCKKYGIKVGDSIQTQFSQDSLMKIFMYKNKFHF